MARFLGLLLALVLAGAAIPAASSYQGENPERSVFLHHDKLSFSGFLNRTQFSFDGFSNQTQFQFNGSQNQTNQGQKISYLIHEIDYLKQEIANALKEKLKDKFQGPFRQDISANKTFAPNQGHQIQINKIYSDARWLHLVHR